MYFVVYILDIKQNRTVPHAWIRHMKDHIETFINNGLNHNRKFYTFWTHRPEAFDNTGVPRADYRINFAAQIANGNDFPREGWYRCQLKKFHRKFRWRLVVFC